jgi:hypothetical protein
VSDGTRTRDVLDHNQVLYQLSYTHHDRRRRLRRRVYRSGRGQLSATDMYLAAMARAASVSGPGWGTKSASR